MDARGDAAPGARDDADDRFDPYDADDRDDRDDRASQVMRVGLARLPSWFDIGRYRPLRTSSSAPAWLLGTLGLVIPLLSAVGAFMGYRAFRRGSRLGLPAVGWCLATAVLSLMMWSYVAAGREPAADPRYSLAVTGVDAGVVPPDGLAFAATRAVSRYEAVDLEVSNLASGPIPMSAAQIEVAAASGERLGAATVDAAFLALSELPTGGVVQVRIYVALPAGASIASVTVGDATVPL